MWVWRCVQCKKNYVSSKLRIREGSFFAGSQLTATQTTYLAATWLEDPQKKVRDVAKKFGISHSTVVDFYETYANNGTVVEIDESLLYKAKYNRGRQLSRPQIWVFGMLERGTNKVAMFQVPARNAATLLPLIQAHVQTGTTIVSDGWSAYGGIKNLQQAYTHQWVNHNLNFVDPTNRTVHTQGIEATWGAFKRKLKAAFGVPSDNLPGHLFSYIFGRYHDRTNLLNRLMIEMKTYRRIIVPRTQPPPVPPPVPVVPIVTPAPIAPVVPLAPPSQIAPIVPNVPIQTTIVPNSQTRRQPGRPRSSTVAPVAPSPVTPLQPTVTRNPQSRRRTGRPRSTTVATLAPRPVAPLQPTVTRNPLSRRRTGRPRSTTVVNIPQPRLPVAAPTPSPVRIARTRRPVSSTSLPPSLNRKRPSGTASTTAKKTRTG